MASIILNHQLNCDRRRDELFDGQLLVYTRRSSTEALANHAIEMISEVLAPDPEKAQFSLDVNAFVKIVGSLKSRFTNDLTTKKLVRDILDDFGCDLDKTYFDVPRLRVVPHGGYLSSGVSYAYKAHRDTWYSSPACQVNWWMPVFDVTSSRAMSFFPEYWDRPVKNSSAGFDYGEWLQVGRTQASSQIKYDARNHPLPLEEIGGVSSELRIAGTKGDIILFSAGYLHATAPNVSGSTRFSVDFRTFNTSDLQSSRGCKNIDNKSTGSTISDFFRASDFSKCDL